ncbi:MAG: dTDP-4-dehydrorhamnose reductase [Planctomycetes bacterium]|nr:dTDP-4-dehydrorhamnose reductase [Planctomycetota bacterium]
MAQILLCGARGMLGRRLHELLASGHRVVATELFEQPGIRALDITDAKSVEAMVEELRPDWIVNAAAYTAVDGAESDAASAHAVNVDGPQNLARALAPTGGRLLHVSTDFVFRGDKEEPYVEDDPTGAVGVYAKSKEEGERRVRQVLPESHAIVRIAWLYGEDGGNFVQTMLRLAGERERLGVVDDQRGTPTYTRDAAAAMLKIMDAGILGTVHAANQGTTTWCGLAREALRLAGSTTTVEAIRTEDYPTAAPRPKNSALRNQVLERTIGDHMRPWQEALAAYIS